MEGFDVWLAHYVGTHVAVNSLMGAFPIFLWNIAMEDSRGVGRSRDVGVDVDDVDFHASGLIQQLTKGILDAEAESLM